MGSSVACGRSRHLPRAQGAPGLRAGTRRYLVQFGYDGLGFAGWARQPGQRTIEEEIRKGLVRLRLAPGAASLSLAVASRTDRGVSARGNALALSSSLEGEDLLRALNGIAPEIWFTRLATIPDDFRPRAAAERWYRYWERPATRVPKAWTIGAGLFQGEVDVRSFGRGLNLEVPARRTVRSIDAVVRSGWLVIDIRARSFVWGMVRKIVSALRALESGALPFDDLRKAVEGKLRLSLPLAEPERLALWEVSYPVPWEIEWPERARRQVAHAEGEKLLAAARAEILSAIEPHEAVVGRPPAKSRLNRPSKRAGTGP